MSTADRTGTPARRALASLFDGPDGETIRIAKWIGHQDNNVAEYFALLEALQHAVAAKAKRCTCSPTRKSSSSR